MPEAVGEKRDDGGREGCAGEPETDDESDRGCRQIQRGEMHAEQHADQARRERAAEDGEV